MKKTVDVVYVIASKLGGVGMGPIGYHAMEGVQRTKSLSYRIFCRGYGKGLNLNRKNVKSYGYLEYASLPLRFLQKKMGVNIDPFKYINYFFGKGVKRNLPKCKIYHTWIGIAKEAILKAKKEGAILVLEAGNSHPLNYAQLINEECKRFNQEEFLIDEKEVKRGWEFYKSFDYIICPSDFVYDSYLKFGFEKEKLIKLHYGVDINEYNVKKDKKDKKFRAIFVGSVQLRKGIQYLLKAWNELKLENAELVICGRIWPDAEKIVKKYKNNKSIKFLNFVDPKEYYKISDVFVFPTIEEGSALVTYEAMASGLPLITTFNSGTVARDNKEAFIIPIRNVETLKEKIKQMYNNPETCKQMSISARKRVEEFSWDNYGKKLVEIYRNILNEKNKN